MCQTSNGYDMKGNEFIVQRKIFYVSNGLPTDIDYYLVNLILVNLILVNLYSSYNSLFFSVIDSITEKNNELYKEYLQWFSFCCFFF